MSNSLNALSRIDILNLTKSSYYAQKANTALLLPCDIVPYFVHFCPEFAHV